VERFHQTLQLECLNGRVFADLDEAQAAVDTFVAQYNHDRPSPRFGFVLHDVA
jgi:transposase InsO family protein